MKKNIFTLVFILITSYSFSQNLLDSLKAYYKFDGNLLDNSGEGNHLMSASVFSFTQNFPNDSAITINGNQRMESINQFDNSYFNEISISFWFKTSTITNTLQSIIQGANMGFGVYIDASSGKISCFFDNTSSGSLMSDLNVADGNWHHLVAQNNGTVTSMYIDGIFNGSNTELISVGNGGINNKLFFGKNLLNQYPYSGELDEVRLYSRILTSCEIDSIVGINSNLNDSLKVYYKFDGDLLDYSGYNIDLQSFGIESYEYRGFSDSALVINGTKVESISTFDNSNYTEVAISFWVKTNSLNNQLIIQGSLAGFALEMETTGEIAVFFDGNSSGLLVGNSIINDGNWHHILAQNNGITTFLYVDGRIDATQPESLLTSNIGSNSKLLFGRNSNNQKQFSGSLDKVRIYNRVLPECMIQKLVSDSTSLLTQVVSFSSRQKMEKRMLYPNPTNGGLQIMVEEQFLGAIINFRSLRGDLIYTEKLKNLGIQYFTFYFPSGVYIAEFIDSYNIRSIQKIIKL